MTHEAERVGAELVLFAARAVVMTAVQPADDHVYLDDRLLAKGAAVAVLAAMPKPAGCRPGVKGGYLVVHPGPVDPHLMYMLNATRADYAPDGAMGSEIARRLAQRGRATVRLTDRFGESVSAPVEGVERLFADYLLLTDYIVTGREVPAGAPDGFELQIYPSVGHSVSVRNALGM